MSTLYTTADTHFGHANSIRYCNRPFLKPGDLDEKGEWSSLEIANERCDWMDTVMVKNWNGRVKPEDTVIHLGDFCFRNTFGGKEGEGSKENRSNDYLNQLNGNVVILKGSHDNNNGINTHIKTIQIEFGKMNFLLRHEPYHDLFEIPSNIDIILIGHVHTAYLYKWLDYPDDLERKLMINVGVDMHDFMPIKMTEVLNLISKIKKGII